MEFFHLVKSQLRQGGVFCMQLSSGGNYVNEAGIRLLSINYHTLKQVFPHVILVPGYATYFLASESSLTLDIPSLLEDRSIETVYVHPDYLDVMRIRFDSDQLMERLSPVNRKTNSDLWPRLFFSSLANFESRMGSRSLVVTGILAVILFFIMLFSFRSLKTGMYVAGFTGAGIQILLIIVVQSYYGYAYKVAPLLITLFMAGIVAGTRLWKIIWDTPTLSKYTGLMWIMALLAAACVIVLKIEQLFIHKTAGQLILGVLNFIPGMLVGSVYGMSLALSKTEGSSAIGRIYSADLAGAALGTFLPVIFIVPLIGITNTFILFCGINVAAGLYILSRWQ
jgi:predicted membrane-bound spermidine synthase